MTQHYDIVLFGATSFIGKLLSQYLTNTFGVNASDCKWAIAGRSQKKLDSLKKKLGQKAEKLPTIIADAHDSEALLDLCHQTRVVISTVGPYALHGGCLVKACAETGTDYCDLTGETHWIRKMINLYENKAKETGARIINCCGFDSIPSDMGVYFLQKKAYEVFGSPCTTVKMRVKNIKGGLSGGTAASLVNIAKEAAANPQLKKALSNPFTLCPENHGFTALQYNVQSPRYDDDFSAWSAPFILAGINTRIVHRSNALSGNLYGNNFKYDEAMLTGSGAKGKRNAYGIATGLAGLLLGAAIKPSRWLLETFILPKSGHGPSTVQQRKGFYDLHFLGATEEGDTIHTRVTGDRDPGYASTAKILGQTAASLAFDLNKHDKPGGFWTPATLFDDRLIDRLKASSGLTFNVLACNNR
ncbi:saccharopine dehydrogenase NADP-binding domain-containing protein [Endozoicomonas sp.]|nr:saccharopine dehydrogenase NADP-binding domain-containing protein [Endozoicomonas sp.]